MKSHHSAKSISESKTVILRKQRGVHLFGRMDSINLKPFLENKYEWITVVPFAGQKDYNTTGVNYYRGDASNIPRRDSAWTSQIGIAHESGFKVFLKPHIWLNNNTKGKWRSDIFPESDDDWDAWSENYKAFIMFYAKIAEKCGVELFCIGTEFTRLTLEKKEFWIALIDEVRSVYSGELTYAANWYEEYEKIEFWDQLDYIGVQAYFPLSKNENPSIEDISIAWNKYIPTLEQLSKQHNRKILFTELGYKSTIDSAIKPWEWVDYNGTKTQTLSLETQANCYQAFFDKVWVQDWFAGAHIWQIRCDRVNSDKSKYDIDFTPRFKPAEQIIAKAFQ